MAFIERINIFCIFGVYQHVTLFWIHGKIILWFIHKTLQWRYSWLSKKYKIGPIENKNWNLFFSLKSSKLRDEQSQKVQDFSRKKLNKSFNHEPWNNVEIKNFIWYMYLAVFIIINGGQLYNFKYHVTFRLIPNTLTFDYYSNFLKI